jgi:hypothetical protein
VLRGAACGAQGLDDVLQGELELLSERFAPAHALRVVRRLPSQEDEPTGCADDGVRETDRRRQRLGVNEPVGSLRS